jgi:hypothetical protein
MKSMEQIALGASGSVSGSGFSRLIRRLDLMRKFSYSSR